MILRNRKIENYSKAEEEKDESNSGVVTRSMLTKLRKEEEESNSSEVPKIHNSNTKANSENMSLKGYHFNLMSVGIIVAMVVCEVSKQVFMYSMQYYNQGKYPVPQTAIVVLMEILKLVVTLVRSKGQMPSFSASNLKSSLRFLIPSVLYALNNNIYFLGLTMVAPPLWIILCSMRTAITATVYKVILKRPLTKMQFLGAFFIVTSISVAKLPDLFNRKDTTVNQLPIAAILLAFIGCANSVGAAVYTETLFKGTGKSNNNNSNNKVDSFLNQQFWLYSYGILVSGFVHFVSNTTYGVFDLTDDLNSMSSQVSYCFFLAVIIGSVGGLVVAAILKYLDNIVREYSSQVANIMTAVVSSFLFPDKFQFTFFVVLSLSFLLVGIYLYESNKVNNDKIENIKKDKEELFKTSAIKM